MHSFPHAIYRFAPAICPFAVQEKAGMHPIWTQQRDCFCQRKSMAMEKQIYH
jgi:hypothetical protein